MNDEGVMLVLVSRGLDKRISFGELRNMGS